MLEKANKAVASPSHQFLYNIILIIKIKPTDRQINL